MLFVFLPFLFLSELKRTKALKKSFLGVYPKCVYWDSFLLILTRGAFSAAPLGRSIICQPCFSSSGLAEGCGAALTQDRHLCLAHDGGDCAASWAFPIRGVGTGALHQGLLLVFPLLLSWRRMKGVLSERHVVMGRWSSPEERKKKKNLSKTMFRLRI